MAKPITVLTFTPTFRLLLCLPVKLPAGYYFLSSDATTTLRKTQELLCQWVPVLNKLSKSSSSPISILLGLPSQPAAMLSALQSWILPWLWCQSVFGKWCAALSCLFALSSLFASWVKSNIVTIGLPLFSSSLVFSLSVPLVFSIRKIILILMKQLKAL